MDKAEAPRKGARGYFELVSKLRIEFIWITSSALVAIVAAGIGLTVWGPIESPNTSLMVGFIISIGGMLVKSLASVGDFLFGGSSRDDTPPPDEAADTPEVGK